MISNKLSLKQYNTFGIDVYCYDFISIETEKQLSDVLSKTTTPVKVLGGGSNILMTGDLPFTILHNRIKGINILKKSEDSIIVEVGAGHNWHKFVTWAVRKGYAGIENLALIPGTVGAAPIQNIGAYGVEQSQCFISLTAFHLSSGKEVILHNDDCQFGYRDSIFKRACKDQYFITHVRYRLSKRHKLVLGYGAIKQKLVENRNTSPTIIDIYQIVIDIRKSKLPDPAILGNSGSFFKNPYVSSRKHQELKEKYPEMPSYPTEGDEMKLAAGWLIDQAGWKGKVVGNTGTYKHQALVIVNHGNATGKEILNLAKAIIDDVEEKYGILLLPEVNIW